MPADSKTSGDWLATLRLIRRSLLTASLALIASLLAYVWLSKLSPAILLAGLLPIGLWLLSWRWQHRVPEGWDALGKEERRPLLTLLSVNAVIAAMLLCGLIVVLLSVRR